MTSPDMYFTLDRLEEIAAEYEAKARARALTAHASEKLFLEGQAYAFSKMERDIQIVRKACEEADAEELEEMQKEQGK